MKEPVVEVVAALRHLSDMEREVVIERAIREQEYEEIAITCGVTPESARDTYQRGLKKLRYHLADVREEI